MSAGDVSTTRRKLAPVIDGACIVAFIVLGRDSHELDEGLSWFFTVLWPLASGWAVGALVTRLYTQAGHVWLRLAGTIAIGLVVGGALRGMFTERASFSVFTAVALAFLSLTTFGWRAVWYLVDRRRRALPAS